MTDLNYALADHHKSWPTTNIVSDRKQLPSQGHRTSGGCYYASAVNELHAAKTLPNTIFLKSAGGRPAGASPRPFAASAPGAMASVWKRIPIDPNVILRAQEPVQTLRFVTLQGDSVPPGQLLVGPWRQTRHRKTKEVRNHMEPEACRAILKRVGWTLIVIGLIDVGVMVYCIVNRRSYSSSFNLFAVIAGIFLLRGGLRTAALVRWFSVFMLVGFLAVAVVAPFLQPWDLSQTELRLNPGTFVIGGIFYFFVLGLLFWVSRQLGLEPVQAAITKAGVKRRDVRYAVAAGIGLAVLLGISIPLISNGESAVRAKSIAIQEVGPRYQFHVSSIRISSVGNRTNASGVVTAWNHQEIRSVPFHWEDK